MKPMTITVTSDDVVVEAIRDTQSGIWDVNYPWGSERFSGSPSEVRALIKRAVRMQTTNNFDAIYAKLRGLKLRHKDQCTDGVMLGAVIRHRLGVSQRRSHPYFDDVDMVGPREKTIMPMALASMYTIDDLIEVAKTHLVKA
jgi:hypothetical protein